jgi:hypothetical protein
MPEYSILDKYEIIFHLAAMSQFGKGVEGHIKDYALAD